MENLPIANEFVRGLEGFSTRRTSLDSFRQGLQAIRNDHTRARNMEDHVEVEVMNRAYSDVRFSFRTLRRRGFSRRFPRNNREMWAYYCVPTEVLAQQLRVSERTIRRRARRNGFPVWPPPSDDHFLMLAIQFRYGPDVAREIIQIPRQIDFITMMGMVRYYFNVDNILSPNAAFGLFCESRGVRRGPIMNDEQWQQVVASPENYYRISLYGFVIPETVY